MANPRKNLNFHRQGRVVAVALIFSSVLGVISTPALADSEVTVPYEVTVFASELPPCDGMEFDPYWSPGEVVYDAGASDIGYVDLTYINYVVMSVDFNVTFGMDGNCDSVVPEGYISYSVTETGSNTSDGGPQGVTCTVDSPCDAWSATDASALLQFSGPGDYAGNFVLTWVLD